MDGHTDVVQHLPREDSTKKVLTNSNITQEHETIQIQCPSVRFSLLLLSELTVLSRPAG